MGRGAGRNPGPWYGDLRKRLAFEKNVRERFPDLRGHLSRNPGFRGWVYELTVPVEHYEPRRVRILFGTPIPNTPQVFVAGPESPHRYGDGALCMWFPKDPPECRWHFDDELELLLGHVMVHLFKEGWWHEYGEWLGDETPHGELPITRQAMRRRAA